VPRSTVPDCPSPPHFADLRLSPCRPCFVAIRDFQSIRRFRLPRGSTVTPVDMALSSSDLQFGGVPGGTTRHLTTIRRLRWSFSPRRSSWRSNHHTRTGTTARAPRLTIRKCRRAPRRGSKSRPEQSSPTRAGLRLLAALQEFASDHRPHGRLTADATTPAWNGYLLTVACSCGVVFERWVTSERAELDLLRVARLN
jgi:hypothetical protein